MLKDLGWRLHGETWGDANAALGIIQRIGLGKARHIETGLLWIQQVSASQRLKFGKVLGTDNPADLFTKYLDQGTGDHHIENLGFMYTQGRASEAPKSHNVSMTMDEYVNGGQLEDWEHLALLKRSRHRRIALLETRMWQRRSLKGLRE